jgi:Fe-S-cluster containining protein
MMKAFECQMCGTCCYGKGGIFVQQDEIDGISKFLRLKPASFLAQYCDEKGGRFYIKTGPNNYCIFYDREKSCLIHPVKPSPCILWPFYPANVKDASNWEMAKDACPGINPDSSFQDFVRQSRE